MMKSREESECQREVPVTAPHKFERELLFKDEKEVTLRRTRLAVHSLTRAVRRQTQPHDALQRCRQPRGAPRPRLRTPNV